MIRYILLWGIRKRLRGFGYLVKTFARNSKIRVQNKYGVSFLADPYEKIDNCIIRNGYFDQDVLDGIESQLKDNDIVWDIGANIGLHALTLKHLHPTIRCVCFEPYYENFKALLENIGLNDEKLDCYNLALHSNTSIHNLHLTAGNAGATGFYATTKSKSVDFKILAISADELLNVTSLEFPNIIKIDTEGNELNILNGMTSILSSNELRALVLECNQDLEKIEAFLGAYGFTMKRLSEAPNFLAYRQT